MPCHLRTVGCFSCSTSGSPTPPRLDICGTSYSQHCWISSPVEHFQNPREGPKPRVIVTIRKLALWKTIFFRQYFRWLVRSTTVVLLEVSTKPFIERGGNGCPNPAACMKSILRAIGISLLHRISSSFFSFFGSYPVFHAMWHRRSRCQMSRKLKRRCQVI